MPAEALFRGEHDYQFIIDLLPALVAYVGPDGRYRRVNKTFGDWFGIPASEIQNRSMEEILDKSYMAIARPHVERALRGEIARFQAEMSYPKGPKMVDVLYQPDLTPDGQVLGFAIYVSDITEQKRREREIQRHAALLDQAMEPLLIWEINGPIEYWNRAAKDLYGFSEAEALGRSSHELLKTIHPIPLPEFLAALAHQDSWAGELIHTTRDGRVITVDSRHQVVVEDGRKLVLESNRDISERKELERSLRRINETLETRVRERTEQLSAANSELEAFSYSVSHDLRAPLRSVDGFGRILLRDFRGRVLDERGIHLVERMSAATVRMGQLIEDLLQLSHVTRSPLKVTTVDLTELASQVWAGLCCQDSTRQVEISIAPNLTVCGDERLLRIALQNLLGNAWKFTGNKNSAKVELGCELIDNRPTYFVADNGVGFDTAHTDQLFVPFQRLHSHGDFEGSGVGLALVQRIIRRHGGVIWGESTLGEGARFLFTLPVEGCECIPS